MKYKLKYDGDVVANKLGLSDVDYELTHTFLIAGQTTDFVLDQLTGGSDAEFCYAGHIFNVEKDI